MIPPAPKRVCYPPIERERHEWKGHIEATVTSSCSRLARFEICASDLSFRPPLTVPPPDPQNPLRHRHDRSRDEVQRRRDDRLRHARYVDGGHVRLRSQTEIQLCPSSPPKTSTLNFSLFCFFSFHRRLSQHIAHLFLFHPFY